MKLQLRPRKLYAYFIGRQHVYSPVAHPTYTNYGFRPIGSAESNLVYAKKWMNYTFFKKDDKCKIFTYSPLDISKWFTSKKAFRSPIPYYSDNLNALTPCHLEQGDDDSIWYLFYRSAYVNRWTRKKELRCFLIQSTPVGLS